jgi:hypothetical protein
MGATRRLRLEKKSYRNEAEATWFQIQRPWCLRGGQGGGDLWLAVTGLLENKKGRGRERGGKRACPFPKIVLPKRAAASHAPRGPRPVFSHPDRVELKKQMLRRAGACVCPCEKRGEGQNGKWGGGGGHNKR